MKDFFLTTPAGKPAPSIAYEKELNPEQLDVVLHGDGPCLVLAGAGSGKTRTITYRVAYLVEHGVAAERILLLTFTNKASKEMLGRVEDLLARGGNTSKGIWGGTFHSVASRLLRSFAREAGISPSYTILDQDDSKDLIKRCSADVAAGFTFRKMPSPSVLQSLVSYSRNAQVPIREAAAKKYPQGREFASLAERIAESYEIRKRQMSALDFDDLLTIFRDLLVQNPVVRERLAQQFQYILVDEYQDTNTVQAEIVRMLSSAHHNLLVVGDDAQSIYSFRAADIKNILRFPDVFSNAKVFRLTSNYRSSPEILGVANAIIKQNEEQFSKELRAVCPAREKPCVIPAASDSQEAQYIGEHIGRMIESGCAPREIAVLFRAAFHSQLLEMELMRRGIAYEYRGGMKFFERAHIKDVLAHLRILANPKDETAWMRVLGLLDGVGLVTAEKMLGQIRGMETFSEMLAWTPEPENRAAREWGRFAQMAKKVAAAQTPASAIRTLVAEWYRAYAEAEYPDAGDRLEDVEQFAAFAEAYGDMTAFLEEVALTDLFGLRQGESEIGDRVVLSTIHQAKGLEWQAVFVMGLSDGKFPNPRALEEDGGLEEERRLFYVAATRAERQLFFTYSSISGRGEAMSYAQPSVFLQDLPSDAVEYVKIRQPVPSHPFRPAASESGWSDEPTIVLDDLGDRPAKPFPKGGFLREIGDL